VGFLAAFGRLTAKSALAYLLGACWAVWVSHLYRNFIRRAKWTALDFRHIIPRFLAGGLIAGLVAAAGYIVLANGILRIGVWDRRLVSIVFIWLAGMLCWSSVYFGSQYFLEYQNAELVRLEMEVLAKDATLRAMLAQINPHFVFNCLNSIRALAGFDTEKVRYMITELAELMRYSLRSGENLEVTLSDEISASESYLNLETIRFEERLRFEIKVDPACRQVKVPPMSVVTLVENAIKHGIARLPGGGAVSLTALADRDCVLISIVNTGQLLSDPDTTHIGLANVAGRLNLLYGPSARVDLRNRDASSVEALLTIPKTNIYARTTY
jgi:hypothetical protein